MIKDLGFFKTKVILKHFETFNISKILLLEYLISRWSYWRMNSTKIRKKSKKEENWLLAYSQSTQEKRVPVTTVCLKPKQQPLKMTNRRTEPSGSHLAK